MSQRGKRGLSRCKKNYPAESYVVTFNDLGLVDSDTAPRFASWMGVEVRARISYLKGWKQVTNQKKDQMWLKAKVLVIFKHNTCAFNYLIYVMCYVLSSFASKKIRRLGISVMM